MKPTLEEQISKGQTFLASGDMASAIVELKNAVRLEPNSASARYLLGKAYFENRNYESSEKELRRALELGSSPSETLPLISASLIRTASFNAILKLDFEDIDLSNENLITLYFYQIQSFAALGKYSMASRLLAEVEDLESDSPYKSLALAYEKIFDSEFQEALDFIRPLREQLQSNEDYLRMELRLLLGLNKLKEAKGTFNELLVIRPEDYQTKFSYLSVLMDSQDYTKAEPLVLEMMNIYENNPLLHQMFGVISVGKSDFENALPNLEFAIKFGLDTDMTRLMAGYSAYRLENFETTSEHLELIQSELYSGHPALRILADSFLRLGQVEKAANTLKKIDDSRSGDHALLIRISELLLRTGDKKSASEFVARSETLASSDSELLQTGIMELSLSEMTGLSKLEQVASQVPASIKLNNALGATYIESGNLDKALSLAKRWEATAPNSPHPHILAMRAHLVRGDVAAAKQDMKKANQLAASSLEVLVASAQLELYQGNGEAAKKTLEKLTELYPDSALPYQLWFKTENKVEKQRIIVEKIQNQLEVAPSTSLRITAAEMLHSLKEYERALSILGEITPDLGISKSFWQIKGSALVKTGNLSLALEHYTLWVNMMPFNTDGMLGHLLVKNEMDEFEDGLSLASEYTKRSSDERLILMKAHLHSALRQTEQAANELSKLSGKNVQSQFEMAVRARVNRQKGIETIDPARAEEVYQETKSTTNLLRLVSAYEKQGRNNASIALIKAHVEERPKDILAKSLLAERLAISVPKGAQKLYEEILTKDANNFHALNNLALLYLNSGKVSEARILAEKAIESKPNSPDALDTLAQTYMSQKNYVKAVQLYRSINTNLVVSDGINFNFAKALALAGERAKATQLLETHQWKDDNLQEKLRALIAS